MGKSEPPYKRQRQRVGGGRGTPLEESDPDESGPEATTQHPRRLQRSRVLSTDFFVTLHEICTV